MKIQTKIPKYDQVRHEQLLNEGFKPLKEPKHLGKMILLSIPFMIIGGLISIFIMNRWFDLYRIMPKESFEFVIDLRVILSLYILTVIHELIHLLFIPKFYQSKTLILGLTWFGGFVHCEDVIKRQRYLMITIAPYVILSILLPILLGLLNVLNTFTIALILLNAAASSVDLLNALFILKQVNKKGVLTSNGIKTYFK